MLSLNGFVRNLIASSVMTPPEVQDYLDTFPPEKKPRDGEALAREMVRDERLTKYQAKRILKGEVTGLVLGGYKILSKIGEGGMGQVFKAQQRSLDRLVAVKVLSSGSVESADAVKRFQQEVGVAAKLNHPNIVVTHDAGQEGDLHYMTMEYVEGRDLATIVKKQGPLSISQAVDCVLQAAQGLAHAHAQGVIHRDIKPGNLLLGSDGVIRILDMGLARALQPEQQSQDGATLAERLTQQGQMLGTVDYISPEQASDTRSADHRSDIYSLGSTLYRLITARPMYEGDSAVAKLVSHCEADIPSLRDAAEQVSPLLEQVFQKMVAKLPQDRYQSVETVIRDLKKCLEHEELLVKDTVKLIPTGSGAEGTSGPEDVTSSQPHTMAGRGDATSLDVSRARGEAESVGVATSSGDPVTVSDSTVRGQSSQKTLVTAASPLTSRDRRADPPESSPGGALTDAGVPGKATGTDEPAAPPAAGKVSLSTTTLVLVALGGGLMGAVLTAVVVYLLLR